MKNVFRLFSSPNSLAATEGTCSGLEYSGWSIPLFFYANSTYFEHSSEFVIFIELFQHIVYGWVVMLLYAQRYLLHTKYRCLHKT